MRDAAYFLFGVFGGLMAINVPELHFASDKFTLYEFINIALTLGLGIYVPFMIKKWIEDNRYIKSFIADEVKVLMVKTDRIKEVMDGCNSVGIITPEDKNKINFLFHEVELQIHSFFEQLKIAFPGQTNAIVGELKNSYFAYKDYLTGDSLMTMDFVKIDNYFFNEHGQEFNTFIIVLKKIIQKIHKM